MGRAIALEYGSYHMWGDVPALMPIASKVVKVPGFRFDGSGGSLKTAATAHTEFRKINEAHRSKALAKGYGFVTVDGIKHQRIESAGIKALSPGSSHKPGSGPDWFDGGPASHASGSKSRKEASALIAKIPFRLSQYIAAHFKQQSKS